MRVELRDVAIAACLLFIAAVGPVKAQTAAAPMVVHDAQTDWKLSEEFVTRAFPDMHFLDQSSRMAIAHSKNEKIRDFAVQIAKAQTVAGVSVMNWLHAGMLVVTGRSSSSSAQTIPMRLGTPRMLPSQAGSLQRLSMLQGHDFDAMYVSAQKDALRHLETVCQNYAADGSDPTLQAIAVGELPKVRQLISALGDL